MKRTPLQKILLSSNESELTPALREELSVQDESFQREYRNMQSTCRLVSLKQYERPEPLVQERCVRVLRQVMVDPRNGGGIEGSWAGFSRVVSGLAVVCVVLLGIHVFSLTSIPALQTAVSEKQLNGRSMSLQEFLASTNGQIQMNSRLSSFRLVPTSDRVHSNSAPYSLPTRPVIFVGD